MRRSRIVSPVHFVWATPQRQPFISDEVRRAVYRCVCTEVRQFRCQILAIGGMPNHVHLAVLFPATVSYSEFMQRVKGTPSRSISEGVLPSDTIFGWQDGYGAFGFHRNQIPDVVAYIRNQERRHSRNALWPDLEEVDEATAASRDHE